MSLFISGLLQNKYVYCRFIFKSVLIYCRFIDSDEDGVISVKDVYNLMMGLGEMLDDDELYGMVTMADLDCDGKLTFRGQYLFHKQIFLQLFCFMF